MTEKLSTLLREQADTPTFAVPDLDAIVRAGDRRARRRTVALASGVAAGVAASAVVAGLVIAAVAPDDTTGLAVATNPPEVAPASPLDTAVPTWAISSALYTPDAQIETGRTIDYFVRTAVGYVFADATGAVYAVDADGVDLVGQTNADRLRLVSDPDGDLAGWVDSSGTKPAFVVLDQRTGQITRDDSHTTPGMGLLADEDDPAFLYALDGSTAYWRDTRGAVAVDVTTGATRVVDPDAVNGYDIYTVGAGKVIFSGEDERALIGTTRADATPLAIVGDLPILSPDGRYLSSPAESAFVLDTTTGSQVTVGGPNLAGGGYDWIDDDTVLVFGSEGPDEPTAILQCTIGAGACLQAADPQLPPGEPDAGFLLPGQGSTDE
ncbi:hypothetical protein [Nocardioides sp. GXZ039]|uniref:hypothetical protein n=1 Tax=Nocardioides sp. GXZ039 TaxID=3136018 RepID=UPI0030F4105A